MAGHKRKDSDAKAPGPKRLEAQDQRQQHHVYELMLSESNGKRKNESEGSDSDAMDVDTELSDPRLELNMDLRLPHVVELFDDGNSLHAIAGSVSMRASSMMPASKTHT